MYDFHSVMFFSSKYLYFAKLRMKNQICSFNCGVGGYVCICLIHVSVHLCVIPNIFMSSSNIWLLINIKADIFQMLPNLRMKMVTPYQFPNRNVLKHTTRNFIISKRFFL